MKKLTIALLMSLAFNSAFIIKAGGETDLDTQDTPKIQVQAKSNVKKDLAKGFAALAGAGIFGYLSYASYLRKEKYFSAYNTTDTLANDFYDKVTQRILNWLPKSEYRTQAAKHSGIVGNALIALPCAAYAAYKFGSVIASKLRSNKNAQTNSSKTRSFRVSDNIDLEKYNQVK